MVPFRIVGHIFHYYVVACMLSVLEISTIKLHDIVIHVFTNVTFYMYHQILWL